MAITGPLRHVPANRASVKIMEKLLGLLYSITNRLDRIGYAIETRPAPQGTMVIDFGDEIVNCFERD